MVLSIYLVIFFQALPTTDRRRNKENQKGVKRPPRGPLFHLDLLKKQLVKPTIP